MVSIGSRRAESTVCSTQTQRREASRANIVLQMYLISANWTEFIGLQN